MSTSNSHNVNAPTPLAANSFYEVNNDQHHSESSPSDPLSPSESSDPSIEEQVTDDPLLLESYILASRVNSSNLRRGLAAIQRNEEKISDRHQSSKLETATEKSAKTNGEGDHLQETAC